MLHFIIGRAGTGKTHRVFDLLAHPPQAGVPLLVVPEQSSFETERAMLLLPEERRAEVLSFSRLYDRAGKLYGGLAGRRASEGEKLLLMTRAVNQNAERLTLYRRQCRRVAFCRQMLALVTECQYGGVTPADLERAAALLPEGALRQKLTEAALLFAAYAALLAQSYLDPGEDLLRLHDRLAQTDFWEDKIVYFDGFKDFTAPQQKLVRQCVGRARAVTVTLCTPTLQAENELALFANLAGLAARLHHMAAEQGVPTAAPEVLTRSYRAENPSMAAAEAVLAGDEAAGTSDGSAITICKCPTKYDEATFVAATVRRLLREEGLRCRDIAVMARDLASYGDLLEDAFRRYEVPFFSDRRRPVTAQPLVAFTKLALSLAAAGPETGDILSLLKTGMTDCDPLAIADLEHYLFLWNVQGEGWRRPFAKRTADPKTAALAERAEAVRRRVMTPLDELTAACAGAKKAVEMAAALYRFLQRFQVERQLTAMAERRRAAGDAFGGEDLLRSYEVVMRVLDQLTDGLAEAKVTAAECSELLDRLFEGTDLGQIPQGIDQVLIGSADRARPANPRVTFLLGANEGRFPAVPAAGGLLTDRDRLQLKQVELPLSDHGAFDSVEERFLFYAAAASPSYRLYCTYLAGEENRPLTLCAPLQRLVRLLPGVVHCTFEDYVHRLHPTLQAEAPGPALELLAAERRAGTPLAAALTRCFADRDPARLPPATEGAACSLTPATARALFGDPLTLSPSKIDRFFHCRFSYFCRYGLGLVARRPVTVDPSLRGQLVHYVLEQLLRERSPEELCALPPEALQGAVEEHIRRFAADWLGEGEQSPRLRYTLARLTELLCSLAVVVAEELRQSNFRPVAMELAIGGKKEGALPPLTLPLPSGGSLRVVGVVDRLDAAKRGEDVYLRVVDYKTNGKPFVLSDLYAGFGLQMPLYLYAVRKNGEAFGARRHPAGVLYLPAQRKAVSLDRAPTDEALQKELLKTHRMEGLIADDPAVLEAMDPARQGRFLPLSYPRGKVSGSLASPAFFDTTERLIDELLIQMGEALRAGDVACDPLDGSRGDDACRYCDFKAACPAADDAAHRTVPALSKETAKLLLEGGDPHALLPNGETTTSH